MDATEHRLQAAGTPPGSSKRRFAWSYFLQGMAGLLGAAWGFVGGLQISGMGLGLLMALCLGACGALLAAGLHSRLAVLLHRRSRP